MDVNPKFPIKHFLFVIILASVIRIMFFVVYLPVAYSDTSSYRRLAEAVVNGFTRYDGTRTPGYPVFMALVGPDERVYIVQLFLGLFTTLLLFWITWTLTHKNGLAILSGLAHTLNLGQLFFEANLLTETLTTFLLITSLALTLLIFTIKKNTIWIAVLIGLVSSLTAITRPLFIYLPFWLMALIVWNSAYYFSLTKHNISHQSRWMSFLKSGSVWKSFATLVPIVLIIGGWLLFIHDRYHMWSLSTMTGYHMIQHTGNIFEYLPDEYAVLRDTYLEYREAHIAEYGTQTNTIWEAIPEMQRVSGLTFYDLSRTVSTLSVWLIVRHPFLFLQNVLEGWWLFWRAPVYWQPGAFQIPILASVSAPLVTFERGVLLVINLSFIVASLPTLFIKRLKPEMPYQRAFNTCVVGTIWIGSILQSLLDHGDNPRFLVPMQSLVVLWLLWSINRIWLMIKMKI